MTQPTAEQQPTGIRLRQRILNVMTGRAVCPAPRPVDEATSLLDAYRAAVLREAADAIDDDLERFFTEWPDEPRNSPYVNGRKAAAADLRRMADEETNR